MESTQAAIQKKLHCRHKGPNGNRCKARPLRGGRYCFWHDPNKSQARKDAGRTGGLQGRRRTLPADIADFSVDSAASVVELLSRTVNQTLRGEVDPKVANAVGYLSGVILRAREQGDIEERIAKIEEALVAQNGGTK
jgi:hypothetical protein